MQCRDQVSTTSDEINATIDKILEEDRQEKLAKDRKRKLNDRQRCEDPQERDRSKKRNCPKPCGNSRYVGVNQSKRFSIRVMEAIRAIVRENNCLCATGCEIVDYVTSNFQSDGDVEAQVRTALKRTCCQGFVKNEGKDSYSLVGPLACQLTKAQKSNANKSMPNESRCCTKRECSPRRRSPSCRRKNDSDTKKSSESELSIPTTVEEDICREKARREMTKEQLNESTSDERFGECLRSPRTNDHQNFDRSANICQPNSKQSTPRQQREEENELLAATRNLDIDFADDDDDDEDYNESFVEPNEEQKTSQIDNENDDDVASDDSALHEIRGREQNVDRDRELKRWIKNCRKECEKRNFKREF